MGLAEGTAEAGPGVAVAGGVPVSVSVDDAEGVLSPAAAAVTDAAHPDARDTTAAATAAVPLVRDAMNTAMYLGRVGRAPGSTGPTATCVPDNLLANPAEDPVAVQGLAAYDVTSVRRGDHLAIARVNAHVVDPAVSVVEDKVSDPR